MPYCPACFDDSVPADEMVFLPCGHGLCKECWKSLVSSALNSSEEDGAPKGELESVPCPGFDGSMRCPHFVELETIFAQVGISPPPEYKRRTEQRKEQAAAKAAPPSFSPELLALYASIQAKHALVRSLARLWFQRQSLVSNSNASNDSNASDHSNDQTNDISKSSSNSNSTSSNSTSSTSTSSTSSNSTSTSNSTSSTSTSTINNNNNNNNPLLNHGYSLESLPPFEAIDYVDEQGRSLLHWAATYRTLGVIDFLHANYGALLALDLADALGRTPLHYAARAGSTVVVQRLLSLGACPCAADAHGRTPLEHAVALPVSESSLLLLRQLLASWLRFNHAHPERAAAPSPALLAAAAARNRSAAIAAVLEAFPATPVDAQDAQGRTPLHLAAGAFATDAVRVLLNAHALCDLPDAHGATPLLHAARQGCGLALTLLLAAGAEPSRADARGFTPLMWAAQNGHTHIVTNLLDRGAHGGPDDLFHALFKARAQQATECSAVIRSAMEINVGAPSLRAIAAENVHRHLALSGPAAASLRDAHPDAHKYLQTYGPSHPSSLISNIQQN